MWTHKEQHGIMPTQYHHFYEQGDTIIYPEHIQDLTVIDQMWTNRIKIERQKEEAKQKAKENNPLKNPIQSINNNKGSGFYGHTFKYK